MIWSLFLTFCWLLFVLNGVRTEDGKGESAGTILDLSMPGYTPKKDEEYVCVSVEVTEPGYIVQFLPQASTDRTHHMLVYGCNDPTFPPGETWDCEHQPICKSPLKILYAWARNAPSTMLPSGVGVPVGSGDGIGYIVLQMHYGKMFAGRVSDYSGVQFQMTPQKPTFVAGVYLLAKGDDVIPANRPAYPMNISCQYNGNADVYPFAFRTHTHQLGTVVSAYKYEGDTQKWIKIGKGDPQSPQMFYPVTQPVTIHPGDVLAAQCVYDSRSRQGSTSIGAHGDDEMCNLYMYYYVDSNHKDPFGSPAVCSNDHRPDLFKSYPSEASRRSSSKGASLEESSKFGNPHFGYIDKASGGGAGIRRIRRSEFGVVVNPGGGDGYGNRGDPIFVNGDGVPVAVVDGAYGQQYPQRPPYLSHVRKKPGPGLAVDGRMVWRADQQGDNGGRYFYANDFGLANQPDTSTASSGFAAVENPNWLPADVTFGQIAGLAFDNKGNILVFHRVDRVWNGNTFDETNRFRERTSGPIMDDPVLVISMGGNVVSRWGRGFFYMPHGVFVDNNNFLWATDVALHQVFKFDMKQSASKPLLSLGTEFEPGIDDHHFCKPAAVAVSSDGTIFVADGYCNNRIMKFNPNGVFVMAWGEATSEVLPNGYPKLGTFSLPHYLSLHDGTKRIFVADRENARVQIFGFNGTVIGQLTDPGFGATVYAVSYCQPIDTVYVLNGPSLTQSVEPRVFAFDGTSRKLMYSWRPQNGAFQRPHAFAVSGECSKIFVGETGPNKLWRFDVNSTGRRASLNGGVKIIEARKPDTVGDGGLHVTSPQNMTQLFTVLSLAVAVPVLVIAAICLCIRFRKRGGFRAMNMTASYNRAKGSKKDGGRLPLLSSAFRDRNGFQRLSTEDVDAMDEISDESDTEDTLYPVAHKNSTTPQKA